MQRASGWLIVIFGILMSWMIWGCTMPTPPPASASLPVAAAHKTLDQWNPQYCKVLEFYGFFHPDQGDTQIAYVLLANPGDPNQKQAVYEARFQLLTRPDGQQQWFLTGLISHAAGLTRRQGWDNLFIPVKTEAAAEK